LRLEEDKKNIKNIRSIFTIFDFSHDQKFGLLIDSMY